MQFSNVYTKNENNKNVPAKGWMIRYNTIPENAKSGFSGEHKSKHRLVSMGICVGEIVFLFSFSSRINFVVSTFAYLSIHSNVHSLFLPALSVFLLLLPFFPLLFFTSSKRSICLPRVTMLVTFLNF